MGFGQTSSSKTHRFSLNANSFLKNVKRTAELKLKVPDSNSFLQLLRNERSLRVFKDPSSSTSYFPEARARFKYHSFLQDYQELLKETEEKRVRLEKTLQMKLQLLAEVKFLRRRCGQFSTTPGSLPFKFIQESRKITSPSAPQHPRSQKRKSLPPQTSAALLDLNETGEAREGFSKQRNLENENSLKKSLREGGEALASPSICQGSGIGLNRAVGKRNVSWQDQLALRV